MTALQSWRKNKVMNFVERSMLEQEIDLEHEEQRIREEEMMEEARVMVRIAGERERNEILAPLR